MYEQRVHRVLQNMREMGLVQALFCDPLSIWYLCGYYNEPYERFFALYLRDEGSRAKSTLFLNQLFPDGTGHADSVVTFTDADDPVALLATRCLADCDLGVDKDLPARWLIPLMDTGAIAHLRLASEAVDAARSTKDSHEQELMRTASLINDQGMAWLAQQVHEGTTEKRIAEDLLGAYRSLGASGHSFSPIVSFADNAADPHHEPDDTPFRRGDMVLFDVGCRYKRYCADMTRTFFTAAPTSHQLEVYDTVRRANEAAERIVAPGVPFSTIDATARRIIEEAGYGPYFTHRLGHQIGLSVHEPGDVSSAHHEPVHPGQVFSIEPGIYLPGDVGVRIEDLVLVTEDGCEILNHYTHEPVVLDVS